MTHQTVAAGSDRSEPRRPLRADFTAYTMGHAVVAKRRARSKHQFLSLTKGLFSMKSLKMLRTVPGAALTLAIVATGSAGVYALNNWFGGNVAVTQTDPTVFSVDLSSCKGNLPGIDNPDRSNVQFKIVGNPHVSVADLQAELLAQCELDAVRDFYGQHDYSLTSATVRAVAGETIALSYQSGGQARENTFRVPAGVKMYNQGQPAVLQDLHPGDAVVLATKSLAEADWQEGADPISLSADVQSIFKTAHDTRLAPDSTKKGFYDQRNIMPLEMYNNLQK